MKIGQLYSTTNVTQIGLFSWGLGSMSVTSSYSNLSRKHSDAQGTVEVQIAVWRRRREFVDAA